MRSTGQSRQAKEQKDSAERCSIFLWFFLHHAALPCDVRVSIKLSRIEICVVYSYFTFRVSLTLLLRACESARIIQTQEHNVLLMNKLIPAVQHSIMWDGEHVHDSKLSNIRTARKERKKNLYGNK